MVQFCSAPVVDVQRHPVVRFDAAVYTAPMNRVPASKWDKLHGTILRTSAELLSGREWLKTGRPK